MKIKMKSNRFQWLLRGGFGALFSGFGLCVTIESAFLKHAGLELWKWVGLGTLGLILFISGLCLLIDALRFRIKLND